MPERPGSRSAERAKTAPFAYAQIDPDSSSGDKLALLGWPESLVKIIRFFAIHPNKRIRFRELQRRLELGSASVKRDLDRLVALGVVKRQVEDSVILYAVSHESAVWVALTRLIRELSAPDVLVKEAVRDVAGIDSAFIYGSVARGEEGPDSDIDLFIVGDDIDRRALYGSLAELEHLTGTQVNSIRYSKSELARKLATNARFVREVLKGEKVWVAGDAKEIEPIAIAARVPLRTS